MNPRGKRAYELKKEGYTWAEVHQMMGYANEANTRRAAMRYAFQSGEQWPLKKKQNPKRAYMLRKTARLKWAVIAKRLGYNRPENAHRAARRYALRTGNAWPLSRYYLCKGEMAYEDLKYGIPAAEIAEVLGFDEPWLVVRSAYNWARRHEKPWPVGEKNDEI